MTKKHERKLLGEDDGEEFCVYGFILWSALLAAGLSLRHESSLRRTCQQAGSWHGARLDPACSC